MKILVFSSLLCLLTTTPDNNGYTPCITHKTTSVRKLSTMCKEIITNQIAKY